MFEKSEKGKRVYAYLECCPRGGLRAWNLAEHRVLPWYPCLV